ncbi:serine hydrolase [Streptomyces sp. NPDC098781]|uniref:serine hydrolase n=1 Tax=Streptomyces sp. NPDC098781 TaxID=3366097 RepID=UPI00382B6218
MSDGPNRTPALHGLRALTLRACAACAAAAVLASLAACSPTATPTLPRAPDPALRAAPGPAAPRKERGATLARALRPLTADGETRLAVAVLDLDSADREIASYGPKGTFATASISKLGILAALLLQAQDQQRDLTDAERQEAAEMIRSSDNAAADSLWEVIGQAEGLDAAHERLGLDSTRGGPGRSWGLTQTTATDQVRLLRAVFTHGPLTSPPPPRGLNPSSRAYIRELMAQIDEDQAWGVSAAGSPGSSWALKNGWIQRNTTGRWVINSTGQTTVHGHRYLVSVLSSGNTTMENGITLVERAARAAVGAASTHVRPWPQ